MQPDTDAPHSTSFIPSLDPLITVQHPSASVLHPLSQHCSVCERPLSGLFSRSICRHCRAPVCADHIKELMSDGRELWVCEVCFKTEVMETRDFELERIAQVLRLRLYGFEQERDRVNKEIATIETRAAEVAQHLQALQQSEEPEDMPVSPSLSLTAELSDHLARVKSEYSALLHENTEIENSLTSLLREEEAMKSDIVAEEQRNQSLACSVIEHGRVLEKRIPVGKLREDLSPRCYSAVKKQFREEAKAAGVMTSRSHSSSSTHPRRCLFC